MRILVLSFYYEPDLCAGSFRNTPIVRKLAELLGQNGQVDVITTLPNRYHSYSAEAAEYEEIENIRIWRVLLPIHKSGMIDQSRAFMSYVKAVWQHTRGQSYDLIYASSSRLMTATLGAVLSRIRGARLYLDIRDIFTDSMGDLLRGSSLRFLLPIFRRVECFTIRQASKVNLVSPGFKEHYSIIDKTKDFRIFTNGIDEEFIEFDFSSQVKKIGSREILYAGNIGEGQGLHRIIPEVAEKLGENWQFRIIGDGGMKSALERALDGANNVLMEPPMERAKLMERYRNADVLFLHLNDYPAFLKVLPSKLFEYGATGKPIMAGVAGHAAEFVKNNIENTAVFQPCDDVGFLNALYTLPLEHTPRDDFVARYKRTHIVEQLAKDILEFG
jgi:glycosyltransferase involved in cell wall biosynthesis